MMLNDASTFVTSSLMQFNSITMFMVITFNNISMRCRPKLPTSSTSILLPSFSPVSCFVRLLILLLLLLCLWSVIICLKYETSIHWNLIPSCSNSRIINDNLESPQWHRRCISRVSVYLQLLFNFTLDLRSIYVRFTFNWGCVLMTSEHV